MDPHHGRLAGALGRLIHVRLDLALTHGLVDVSRRARRLGKSGAWKCGADRTACHDLQELVPVHAICRIFFHEFLLPICDHGVKVDPAAYANDTKIKRNGTLVCTPPATASSVEAEEAAGTIGTYVFRGTTPARPGRQMIVSRVGRAFNWPPVSPAVP